MAKSIEITSFTKTGNGAYGASGTIDGVTFSAATIVYRGEPIFKVQEVNEEGEVGLRRMDASQFSRGQRIAIARALKQERLRRESTDTVELAKQSVKELRKLCKESGLSGYSRKGVRKVDLVAMLSGNAVTAQAA